MEAIRQKVSLIFKTHICKYSIKRKYLPTLFCVSNSCSLIVQERGRKRSEREGEGFLLSESIRLTLERYYSKRYQVKYHRRNFKLSLIMSLFF